MDIVNDMLAYTKLCFERFGDRVKHWITFNEVCRLTQEGLDGAVGIDLLSGCQPFVYAILGLVGITKDFDIKKDLWTCVSHEGCSRTSLISSSWSQRRPPSNSRPRIHRRPVPQELST